MGGNEYGQLGLGDNVNYSTPQEVVIPKNYEVEELELGGSSTGVVINDGTDDHLYMWGSNGSGQLGLGDYTNYNTPQEVATYGYEITDLEIGGYHSGAVVNDGTDDHLYMWGYNRDGQLGVGNWNTHNTPQEVNVGGNDVNNLELGNSHSGAIVNDGTNDHLYMSGDNGSGQLGLGNNTNHNSPQKVLNWDGGGNLDSIYKSGYEITDLSLGYHHSGAVINDSSTNDDHLYMWGDNSWGQIGDGTNIIHYNYPDELSNPQGYEITDFEVGSYHSGISLNGPSINENTLYMWGANSWGQLGNGDKIDYNSPQKIIIIKDYNDTTINEITNITQTSASIEFNIYDTLYVDTGDVTLVIIDNEANTNKTITTTIDENGVVVITELNPNTFYTIRSIEYNNVTTNLFSNNTFFTNFELTNSEVNINTTTENTIVEITGLLGNEIIEQPLTDANNWVNLIVIGDDNSEIIISSTIDVYGTIKFDWKDYDGNGSSLNSNELYKLTVVEYEYGVVNFKINNTFWTEEIIFISETPVIIWIVVVIIILLLIIIMALVYWKIKSDNDKLLVELENMSPNSD